jgi:hypothetical protein
MVSARAAKRTSEAIALDLELYRVRKGRGVVHLTVRADSGQPVETLCERHFEADEYELTDLEPTCAACLRRSEDPSRLSNAMFGQDLGARLLELSLSSAPKRPEDQQADEKAARAQPPRLRVISTAPAEPAGARASQTPAPPAIVKRPRPAGLDLAAFEEMGNDRYRSPGGVLIRVVKRAGGGWDVSEVDFEGEAGLEQLPDGRVRVRIGDLRFEYAGDFERRVRRD